MKQLLTILIFLPFTLLSQTEEERRAIIAAKNKIESDSISLHSRSSRISEQRKQIEVLEDALRSALRTMELQDTIEKTRREQVMAEKTLRLNAEEETLEAKEAKEKADKRKKAWRKVSVGLAIVVAVETLIIFL